MRGIGARITLWYALGATISFAILSIVGGALLQTRLMASLDALNGAEFRQLKEHIGADFATISAGELGRRLRTVDQYQSVLFYVAIDAPAKHQTIFSSHNLRGEQIPDVKGARVYSADAPGLGPLRVEEFLLPPYDVTIATSARAVREGERAYVAIAAGLVLVMLVISFLIGHSFSHFVLQPIRRIRATAERIDSDNLRDRIPVAHARDEVDELALLLNSMFDRLEAAFSQMQRFSEEVSHELKTPLALLRLHAESMVKSVTSEAHADAAVEQIEEIDRLTNFIDQMLFLSRAEANAIRFDLEPLDPAAFLRSFAHDAEALAEHSGHRFEFGASGAGKVGLDASWIRQLLFNLISNALRVTPEGGVVRLTSEFAGEMWRLVIEDEGPGLSDENCERMFERFTQLGPRADRDRGSGLGLAIARGIAKLHGGTLRAERRQDRSGLRLIVELPAEPELAAEPLSTVASG